MSKTGGPVQWCPHHVGRWLIDADVGGQQQRLDDFGTILLSGQKKRRPLGLARLDVDIDTGVMQKLSDDVARSGEM